jgi:tRNA(fMet)-specific endonuclease VapC
MRYLLDTNIWILYLKGRADRLVQELGSRPANEFASCSIVRAELLHGAEKYGNAAQRIARVEATLAPFVSLPFDDQAAKHYGPLRHLLEIAGGAIGPYDLQIAAIALSHQLTLISDNDREFRRVPQLTVENWIS